MDKMDGCTRLNKVDETAGKARRFPKVQGLCGRIYLKESIVFPV